MLAPRSVALAFGPDAAALDLAGPMDVFSAATAMLGEGAGYRLLLVSPQDGPVRLSNGSRMLPDLRCADANERYDVVLAAGGPTPAHDSALSGWLRRACPRARVHGSICTGAFALGHAGLLDGHTVTTHWEFADELATRFPAARVEPDRIHAQRRADHLGRRNRRHRPGLALVAEDHGAELALRIAQKLVVVAQRQGGQSQFSPYLSAPQDPGTPIARVQAHVMEHAGDDYSVARLAAIAGMSARSFARHFTQAAGITPREFIERARVDAARRLLEGSRQPLKAIAYDCGFGNADNMRRVFQRRLRVSPADYRARFNRDA